MVNYILLYSISDCLSRCSFKTHPFTNAPTIGQPSCFVTMPDNPLFMSSRTLPCELGVGSNCTGTCRVLLEFVKFNLQPCEKKVIEHLEMPDQLMNDSCRYINE